MLCCDVLCCIVMCCVVLCCVVVYFHVPAFIDRLHLVFSSFMPFLFTSSLSSSLSLASYINIVLFTRLTVSGNAAQAAEVHLWLLVQTLECGNDKLLRHYENSHSTNSAVDPIFHQLHRT